MPDVRESLIAFYKLLKETFPLEGMVMHHFLPSSQSLLELHFIHDGGIHFLGRFIPFSREQTMFLRAFSLTGGVNAIPNSQEVREYIENRPRAHLVCCLKGAGAPLGLLRLIGTEVGCFTEEHERRLGLLAIPLSFALVKVLREEEVQRFFSAHGYDTPSQSPHEDDAPAELIGTSGGLRNVMETVRKLSGTDAPVLILGETGVGKELLAHYIHDCSGRTGPFVPVHPASIPDGLFESEFFGHEKGAFTGAIRQKIGLFELADQGTLFIDEVGEIPPLIQTKLLRVLQDQRFMRLGGTREILSRFRTPQHQAEILKQLKRGEIDMIIGTHRLVQKDVQFRDLGLVIIEEEQRFGVAQKERFKSVTKNVDVLTLSATPIPRTLNMALSGIRDMSSLEEAPQDRHPVQTYVLEYDQAVINDAVRRELRRGGQVYYLHNKVESIERVAARLQAQIPEAKVGFGHGKMPEGELSEVWRRGMEQEINVLVCTTIIETGIDLPNANTLIIEDADHLGLAQLHQIRGRIGRSTRRAYAYLTYRQGKILQETAAKRLAAIREYVEFGSGFKIAMRDLEIRGAGNLLGPEQSGYLMSVGYDLYLKLLEEAVLPQQGQPVPKRTDCAANLTVAASIPDRYVPAQEQRMDLYRRIAALRTEQDADDLVDDFVNTMTATYPGVQTACDEPLQ